MNPPSDSSPQLFRYTRQGPSADGLTPGPVKEDWVPIIGWQVKVTLPDSFETRALLPPALCPQGAKFSSWSDTMASVTADRFMSKLTVRVAPVVDIRHLHPGAGPIAIGTPGAPFLAVPPQPPATPVDAAASATQTPDLEKSTAPAGPPPAPTAPAHESAAPATSSGTEHRDGAERSQPQATPVPDVRKLILQTLRDHKPPGGPEAAQAGYRLAVLEVCNALAADALENELWEAGVRADELTEAHNLGEHIGATRQLFGFVR